MTPGEPDLDPCDRWMGLAAAVVLQALEDLEGEDLEQAARAAAWLLGPGLAWCRALGVRPERLVARVRAAQF